MTFGHNIAYTRNGINAPIILLLWRFHYVKSVRNRNFACPYFPPFGLITDQKNSKYGHCSRNVCHSSQKKVVLVSLVTDARAPIQNPVKHLRCSFFAKNN